MSLTIAGVSVNIFFIMHAAGQSNVKCMRLSNLQY